MTEITSDRIDDFYREAMSAVGMMLSAFEQVQHEAPWFEKAFEKGQAFLGKYKGGYESIMKQQTPGLRKGELSRAAKKDHLEGMGVKGEEADKILDQLYGKQEN